MSHASDNHNNLFTGHFPQWRRQDLVRRGHRTKLGLNANTGN